MARLDDFTKEERELLVRLPYRVGLWISMSDQTGGDEADDAEMQALEQIVIAFVEDFCKSEFVEEIMRETTARRESWPEWQDNLDAVPEECDRAVSLVAEKLEQRDVTYFKHNLMEIAVDVAMAFREVDYSEDMVAKLKVYTRYYLDVFRARIKKEQPPSLEDNLNISPAERAALKKLEESLRMDVLEGIVIEEEPAYVALMREREAAGEQPESGAADKDQEEDGQEEDEETAAKADETAA